MKSLLAFGLVVFLTGCAHLPKSSKSDDDARIGSANSSPKTLDQVLTQDINSLPSGTNTHLAPPKVVETDVGAISVNGVKLKNTHFDIPIVINSRVEYWVDYFSGRGRGYFEKYLERSEYFIPYIAPLLRQNGLPEDLVYLSMIESGFNNYARSRARAVGPWQFISATGKRYGLMVNWWVDERRDIAKSTLAAVGYLKDLYTMFNSWELAAAAYNAGEAKIARAIQRFGTRDFWVISKHRFLRQETRDYVPKIIAAAIISKNREQFGFKVETQKPGAGEVVAGDGEVIKVVKTDKPLEDDQNVKHDAPADVDDDLAEDEEMSSPDLMPTTQTFPMDSALPEGTVAGNDGQPLAKPIPTPHVSKNGQVSGEQLAEFEVQSPADLLKVARAAGLSYQTVKGLNPELMRWCTPPTVASYRLRLPESVKDRFLQTYNHEAFPRKVQFMTYKVRHGETLSRIAKHFGIKVDPISDLNGVSPRMPLRTGVKVLLPIPNDRSRSLASLDVRDPPEARRSRHHRRRRQKYYKITYKRRESARSRVRYAQDNS